MIRSTNNNDRVLRALEEAGGYGIVQSDWVESTPDGGPPVLRLAAVVWRLRERGHHIETTIRADRQASYVLRSRVET